MFLYDKIYIINMLNQQLVNYIRKAYQAGMSKEEIRQSLISAGWKDWDINVAFSFVDVDGDNHVVGSFPEPVIEKIKTLDDLVCDMLRRGKSRDEIFDELLDVYNYDEIKTAFDKNLMIEEKRMSPSASLGFIMVALSFLSFLSIVWDKLTGSFRISAIIIFCLFYFLSGLYLKYKERILFGGEVICFFSVISSGVSIYLLSDLNFIPINLIEALSLWTFVVIVIALIIKGVAIMKFGILTGFVFVGLALYKMIINKEYLMGEEFIYTNMYVIFLLLCLCLAVLWVKKRVKK